MPVRTSIAFSWSGAATALFCAFLGIHFNSEGVQAGRNRPPVQSQAAGGGLRNPAQQLDDPNYSRFEHVSKELERLKAGGDAAGKMQNQMEIFGKCVKTVQKYVSDGDFSVVGKKLVMGELELMPFREGRDLLPTYLESHANNTVIFYNDGSEAEAFEIKQHLLDLGARKGDILLIDTRVVVGGSSSVEVEDAADGKSGGKGRKKALKKKSKGKKTTKYDEAMAEFDKIEKPKWLRRTVEDGVYYTVNQSRRYPQVVMMNTFVGHSVDELIAKEKLLFEAAAKSQESGDVTEAGTTKCESSPETDFNKYDFIFKKLPGNSIREFIKEKKEISDIVVFRDSSFENTRALAQVEPFTSCWFCPEKCGMTVVDFGDPEVIAGLMTPEISEAIKMNKLRMELMAITSIDTELPIVFVKGRYIGGVKEIQFIKNKANLERLKRLSAVAENQTPETCDDTPEPCHDTPDSADTPEVEGRIKRSKRSAMTQASPSPSKVKLSAEGEADAFSVVAEKVVNEYEQNYTTWMNLTHMNDLISSGKTLPRMGR